ncbi:F-box protein At2g17036-like [Papaver somniferum]|uniref:F-box protein At2g17036-like n=1 Tax=Papaver somniferum TaxID=3469 RepID=UPI000E6FCEA2|nr:F-box protein At2g17036-like [Papaver somniferum]
MYKADWSELPKELLTEISQHLNDKVNVRRFRAVCTTFRSSANLISSLALKLPSPIKSINNEETPSRFCVLLETTIYAVRLPHEAGNSNGGGGGDSQVWVIKVEGKIGKDKVVQLVNPLSRVQIKPLPRNFPKVFQLLDFHVVELCKEYVLKHHHSELQEAYLVQIPNSQYSVEVKELYVGEVDVKKVVILSSNPNLPTNDDVYGVMVLCREGNLVLIKPKENQKWNVLDEDYRFRDVVSYNGNFYAVDAAGRAVVVDTNLELNVVAEPPVTVGGGTEKRLVISDGDLFLVDVYMYSGSDDSDGDENGDQTESDDEEIPLVLDYEAIPCEFEVYKLDECNLRWVRVEDLGGRVFVIGERSSFSVWPRDLSRHKGNCIFFMDGLYTSYGAEEDREVYIHNTGLFSLEDKKIGPGSFASYNQLFWPPPSWIMPN